MKPPPPTQNEPERLAVLQSYSILDTPLEKEFDDLVAMAAHICNTPIAMISLVDEERQWFKAAFGLNLRQTAREISFCGHAIHQTEVFMVPDATQDQRFADNPLVTGELGVRFYAGSTLITSEGVPLGTLCVLDREPRKLTSVQKKMLTILSRHVMAQLDLRRQSQEMTRANSSLLGILEDQLRAETALRESEEFNRGVLNSMMAHIAVLDHSGKIIAVNDAWRQFAQDNLDQREDLLARSEVGTNYLDICRSNQGDFAAESRAAHDGLLAVLRGEKKHFTLEYPCLIRKTRCWFLLSATPLKAKSGGAAVSHLDISEAKLAEEELRWKTAFLEAQVNSTLDGLLVVDNHEKIILQNQRLVELWKIPRELTESQEDQAQINFIINRTKDPEAFVAKLKYLSEHPDEVSRDEILLSDGMILDRYSAPVKDKNGKHYGRIWAFRDMTERRQLEEQFRQSQKMESIGQLAGGIAHDFNNILAVIQMQSDLLVYDGVLSLEQRENLDEIISATQRASNLTRQLLLFSRNEKMLSRDLNLSENVSNMTKMLRRILGDDIQMHLKIAPQPLLTHADSGMVDQIIMNLAVNARDAMPQGGKLQIATASVDYDELAAGQTPQARPGSFVCLSVADTGLGIPPEILPRIFEPFFTTKGVGKGTGLGLATVFGIVQQHHGWINVSSEPGRGTIFKIYLPRLSKFSPESKPVADLRAENQRGTETILLVEDDASLRGAFSKTLTQLGYRVIEAGNGASALELWKKHSQEISLLLTDLMMPGGMTGQEFAEPLLKSERRLKVIYMSGYSSSITVADLQVDDRVNFLAKPFDSQTLAQTIRAALGPPTPKN